MPAAGSSDDNALESLDLDADATAAELGGNYEHLSATQFVIVPEAISRLLPNSSLRSVAIRLDLNERTCACSRCRPAEMAEKEELAERRSTARRSSTIIATQPTSRCATPALGHAGQGRQR